MAQGPGEGISPREFEDLCKEGIWFVKLSRHLRIPATALAILALAACQQSSEPAGEAEPDAKPGLSVSDGRLVLPAVEGNPGVAYFTVTNSSPASTSLAAVHVEGVGTAEMHETKGGKMEAIDQVQLEPQGTADFEPGGKHVMLFDLSDELDAGSSTEMTLVFSGGDKLSTPLTIEAPGSRAQEAANHGEAH